MSKSPHLTHKLRSHISPLGRRVPHLRGEPLAYIILEMEHCTCKLRLISRDTVSQFWIQMLWFLPFFISCWIEGQLAPETET